MVEVQKVPLALPEASIFFNHLRQGHSVVFSLVGVWRDFFLTLFVFSLDVNLSQLWYKKIASLLIFSFAFSISPFPIIFCSPPQSRSPHENTVLKCQGFKNQLSVCWIKRVFVQPRPLLFTLDRNKPKSQIFCYQFDTLLIIIILNETSKCRNQNPANQRTHTTIASKETKNLTQEQSTEP